MGWRHEYQPPVDSALKLDRAHDFARDMVHCWVFDQRMTAVDIASGYHLQPVSARIPYLCHLGRGAAPSAVRRYTTSTSGNDIAPGWVQRPDGQPFSLSLFMWRDDLANVHNGGIAGWNGSDDIVLYPCDSDGVPGEGGRLFWRDLPLTVSDTDFVRAGSRTQMFELQALTSEGGTSAQVRFVHGFAEAISHNSLAFPLRFQHTGQAGLDTTSSRGFSSFCFNGHDIGQYDTNARLMMVALHDAPVHPDVYQELLDAPWSWLRRAKVFAFVPAGASGATGTVDQALAAATQSAEGLADTVGAVSQTLSGFAQAASGALSIAGTAAQELSTASQAASGTLTVDGAAAQELSPASQSAAGTVAITGTVSQTTEEATQSLSGEHVSLGPRTGDVAQTLARATQAVSGTHEQTVSGGAAQTLSAATQAVAAEQIIAGTVAQVMAAATQAGIGLERVEAVAVQTLAAVTQAASVAIEFSGAAAQIITAASQTAAGTSTQDASGAVAQTLAAAAQAAVGNVTEVVVIEPRFLPQLEADLDTFFALGDEEQFATDLEVFMDAEDGFATTVTVDGTTVYGIFDDHAADGGERAGPQVILKTSDVDNESIDQGTVLTIDSRTFHVAGVQRDGVGVSTVILIEAS